MVVAGFAALLLSSRSYAWSGPASGEPYNLVVEGFRSGHVWMAKEAPPGLASAANPYAFAAYRPYLAPPWGLVDLSYFKGHLYAYFGVTPAVILFWPYRALTGHPLHQAIAVFGFGVLGYAVAVGLAVAAWRRYFPRVRSWAGAAIALLLGSVTTLPVFLVRPGLYEVSISCGFALAMLSLAALWNAWHRPGGKCLWIAAASLAFGLAVGARPSLLFGSVILFLPALATFRSGLREGRHAPWLRQFLAALLPISAVGAGLAAYNYSRFGDPLQFGHDYQLSGNNVYGTKSFALRFAWDNVRLYFLEPLRWHRDFPFVWEPVAPALSPGHLPIEFFFGTLASLPILLAAALAPLAWIGGRGRPLRGFSAALLILFLAGAVPICCYAGATSRYLLDFIPALALLALLGFLGAERMLGGALDPGEEDLSPPQAALSGSPLSAVLRAAVHCALAFSVAVGWLLAVALCSFYAGAERGMAALASGRIAEGVAVYNRVCRINPDFRGQAEMLIGSALIDRGRRKEGIEYLKSSVTDEPGLAAAHVNLGRAYLAEGRFGEAADALRFAAGLDPFDAEAESDLAVALFRLGRLGEAVEHARAAVRIDPTLMGARDNLRAFEAAQQHGSKP